MNPSTTWRVIGCQAVTDAKSSETILTSLVWQCIVKTESSKAIYTGSSLLPKPNPESLIPFDEISEDQMIQWILNEVGTEGMAKIESDLMLQLEPEETFDVRPPWVGQEVSMSLQP